jgi:hypothetical protein
LGGGNIGRLPGLVNLSVRSTLAPNETLIAGFVILGPSPASVLARAVGPTLAQFGVGSPMANPRLQVFNSSGRMVAQNDDWSSNSIQIGWSVTGAFPLAAGSRDAEVYVTLAPGSYTLVISGSTSTEAGVVLGEIYNTPVYVSTSPEDPPYPPGGWLPRLTNISVRGRVEGPPPSLILLPTGGGLQSSMIAGFVVAEPSPSTRRRYLIRVSGPALEQFGVAGALADPSLELAGTNGTILQTSDNWDADPAAAAAIREATSAVGAFPLPPGSRDAAIIATVPAGAYTVIARGANGSTGSTLIEIYELEN